MDNDKIELLRKDIDLIDSEIIAMIEKRQSFAKKIIKIKNEEDFLIEDSGREGKIIKKLSENSKLPKGMIKELFVIIFNDSKKSY